MRVGKLWEEDAGEEVGGGEMRSQIMAAVSVPVIYF